MKKAKCDKGQIQRKIIKVIGRLENKLYKERLKELFSLETRWPRRYDSTL